MFVFFLIVWFLLLGTAFGDPMTNNWAVQMGSFKNEENAQVFIRTIKKKGYTPFIVRSEESDWYKARLGPYPLYGRSWPGGAWLKKAQGK